MHYGFGFVIQMIEYLLEHYRVFDADNNLGSAAAFPADIDIEDTLQTLYPGLCGPIFDGCFRFIGYLCRVPPGALSAARDRNPGVLLRGSRIS